ncbi:MerR family transcriptional regulator [Nonomuraea harbinensis]|uniref:MerR family transcriptional regulator n=1 Tax=Nonomuraea harbinensis TaxID=1286938 RepID=A0ABW1BV22_9ACTN|nr:MerR family transcriptional regulator [Nonomuraea harbinensis]
MDEFIPIGEAARMLGMNASALRYYEERGLVPPAGRRQGRRVYGRDELRRLVFLQSAQRLGIPLDTAGAVLEAPGEQWRATVCERIEALEELIERARTAQEFLRHAIDCPAEHPVRECDFLRGILDRMLEGLTLEQVAAEHALTDARPTA